LLWTYRALSSGKSAAANDVLRAAIAKVELDAPWQSFDTAAGQKMFRWPAAGPAPTAIKMASAPATGMTAVAQYESREPETSTLPVKLERRLYRLVRGDAPAKEEKAAAAQPAMKAKKGAQPVPVAADASHFTLELLEADAVLKTDEVYLDEVVLKRTSGSAMRFGIVEVPLPPGANTDRTTWGIAVRFPGAAAPEALERARYEQTPRGYAVPVDVLDGEVVIRHLVRPTQTGSFALPPARYYRMYQPDQKAFEEKPRARIEIR
jgi:uncharacterized protein YfaS (alpha-2-macroglobulin family)